MARFLIIGLDGAEPSLMAPWMDEGLLPNLARLRARGTFAPLESTFPPATFPAWTSCVTGVNPGRHGLFDFTETTGTPPTLHFTNAGSRKVPALWNILSDARKRVGILGVPATYPPEPVNGFMVSGFDSPVATNINPSFVWPPDWFPEVRDWRFADMQESNIGPKWHARALPALLRKIDDKERIACQLLSKEPWDFFMVVFGETDTVSHHFWMFHDQNSPRHRPGFETAIQSVYQRLDHTVGALMEAAGDDVVVCVVSDHGFGGAGDGVIHINNWLAEQGYLRFRDGAGGSALKRAALRWVPAPWRGSLFRRFSGLATRAETKSRFGRIDWEHTTAWSEELNYFPSVRINRPRGMTDTAYAALITEICARLESWAPVARAWPRETRYHGDYVDRAPDILLELALENGYAHSCLRTPEGDLRPFRRLAPAEYPGGKERGMNGSHRGMGVLLSSEPVTRPNPSLYDITPTVLSVLGVTAPPMDGRPLWGHTPEGTAPPTTPRAETPYTKEEERLLEAQWRGLGYLE